MTKAASVLLLALLSASAFGADGTALRPDAEKSSYSLEISGGYAQFFGPNSMFGIAARRKITNRLELGAFWLVLPHTEAASYDPVLGFQGSATYFDKLFGLDTKYRLTDRPSGFYLGLKLGVDLESSTFGETTAMLFGGSVGYDFALSRNLKIGIEESLMLTTPIHGSESGWSFFTTLVGLTYQF